MSDTARTTRVPTTTELLEDQPKNWGKWGSDDEVGALNYLGSREALAGVAEVRQGKTFTLQVQIGNPKGDPTFPGPRGPARRVVGADSAGRPLRYTASVGIALAGPQETRETLIRRADAAMYHAKATGSGYGLAP